MTQNNTSTGGGGRRGNKKPETEEEKRKNFLERNRQGFYSPPFLSHLSSLIHF
jgi:ATF/CREB family transcription factor